MKAFVIQVKASGEPPRSCAIAGVATAPAEKLRGNVNAARQTAASTEWREVGVFRDISVMEAPVQKMPR
ncbi:hypothetical protein D3C80_1689440 [compost metagenome]